MYLLRALICSLCFGLIAPFAQAQMSDSAVHMPAKGQSMGQVEKKFGAPKEKLAAIGEPPITRWIYPNYTVYFEHTHVIHSVVEKKRSTP